MIVPSKRRYLYDLNHLCINHLYNIDSGMGGSFTVQYKGIESDYHHFVRPEREDWPRADYLYTPEQVKANVYISPPENTIYAKWWDETRQKRPQFSEIYNAIEGWFPALTKN